MDGYEEELVAGDVPNMSNGALNQVLSSMQAMMEHAQEMGFMINPVFNVPTRLWDEMERRQIPEFVRLRDEGKIRRVTLGMAYEAVDLARLYEYIHEPGICECFTPDPISLN